MGEFNDHDGAPFYDPIMRNRGIAGENVGIWFASAPEELLVKFDHTQYGWVMDEHFDLQIWPGVPRARLHAHISGEMNTKLTLVVTTEGSTRPETMMTMTWLGACKPGMKGGDVVMSNGMKMNVLDGTMSGVPAH